MKKFDCKVTFTFETIPMPEGTTREMIVGFIENALSMSLSFIRFKPHIEYDIKDRDTLTVVKGGKIQ